MPVMMTGGGSTAPSTPTPTPNYGGAVNKLTNSILPTNNTPQKLAQSATSPSLPKIPSAITNAAAQKPVAPKPVYSGASINSIPHVASTLGVHSAQNPDGTYNVNNVTIKPISTVNGQGHAPVSQIASAAGYHPSLVQSSPQGTTVMPNATATTVTPSGQLNQYWTNVKNAGGAWGDPQAQGMTVQQAVEHEAKQYGVLPSQVQVEKNAQGQYRTFVPWKYVQNYAEKQSTASSQAQQNTQPQQPAYNPLTALQGIQGQYLGNMASTAPQAPQLQQLPTLDPSTFQPFNWNMGADYTNVYNSLNPTYQQQMMNADQKINDSMNNRGMYNSGIAQQAVDSQNNALTGTEWNAINKQVNTDQGTALKAWQDNNTNQLNVYKANIDAMYKNGQLSDQQYADAINTWGKLVSAQTSMANQDASMIGKMMPYTMGPTPQQLTTDQLAQNKQVQSALQAAGYTMMPDGSVVPTLQANQDAFNNAFNQYKFNNLSADQAATLGLNYAKFQQTVQQNQVTDAQKWASIMGYDANGNPTLNMQKLQVTMQNDVQKAAQAAATASNNAAKTQLTGLHDQLVAAGNYITNLTAQQVSASDPRMQSAVQNYNAINDEIAGIVAGMGTTSGGSAQYSPGSPLAMPN